MRQARVPLPGTCQASGTRGRATLVRSIAAKITSERAVSRRIKVKLVTRNRINPLSQQKSARPPYSRVCAARRARRLTRARERGGASFGDDETRTSPRASESAIVAHHKNAGRTTPHSNRAMACVQPAWASTALRAPALLPTRPFYTVRISFSLEATNPPTSSSYFFTAFCTLSS